MRPALRLLLTVGLALALGPGATALADAAPTTLGADAAAGPDTLEPAPAVDPIPMMAYYYIWFEPSSWSRAKRDLPTLGRYSSDDPEVMAKHLDWAQAAGIDGFIVSWKWTDTLDRRLEQLATLADARGFRLWIIYQGLDVAREPLPVARVEMDLQHLLDAYGNHPSLRGPEGVPLVIWSGTWKFSTAEIRSVAAALRPALTLLASERSIAGIERLTGAVDGNAYYWSSADPLTGQAGYAARLRAMGEAVHAAGGLWVAPAAPGFDATLLGGTTVVARHGTLTLQRELGAALDASPDAIGLISWNEFSENTHLEPSERYGNAALTALAARAESPLPAAIDADSSDPGTTDRNDPTGFLLLGTTGLALLAGLVFLTLRSASMASARPARLRAAREGEDA